MIRLLKDTLWDWPIGTILGIMLLFALLALVALFLWGTFVALDSWFRPVREGTGIVVSKEFVPAHTTYYYNAATKTPMPIFHANAWYISISIQNQCDEVNVDQDSYETAKPGRKVNVAYVLGRLSGRLYIKDYLG